MLLRNCIRSLLAAASIAALLAGCTGKAPEPTPPSKPAGPVDSVTPKSLEVSTLGGYGAEQQLALSLIAHYLGAPLYRMSNPLPMSRDYRVGGAIHSPGAEQVVVTMRSLDERRWALVTLSASPGAVMNAFDVVRNGQPGYALVLKQARICLVEGADQLPVWGGTGWAFSKTGPGRFECSGQTNGSLYQPYSGMPGLMGVYAESGDTVLYGESWPRLKAIASGLATVFPHLQVPRIR